MGDYGMELKVRVKRCGKSAPLGRQRKRHGKPHREQNRIGATETCLQVSGVLSPRCSGWLREVCRKAHPRRMTVQAPYGAGQNPAYRPSGISPHFRHFMGFRVPLWGAHPKNENIRRTNNDNLLLLYSVFGILASQTILTYYFINRSFLLFFLLF